ncbi:MAG: TRAP transporter fused permease subunit [Hyphomicrobiaceae bacterium]|nr:TRAP transporter fused permease subunit [Hyphomicrobiaceae bacterium]
MNDADKMQQPVIASDEPPSGRMNGAALWVAVVLGVIGIFLNINQLFNLKFFIDKLIIDTSYYYLLAGIFLGLAFLIYPAHGGARNHVPWYDWLLFAVTLGATGWLAWNGERIVQEGWETRAPIEITLLSGIFCLLALEGVRRVGGLILFCICLFFFTYPLFAESMPGFMWGPSSSVEELVLKHALGTESIIGVPMRVVAGLLIGFLIFGSALVVTGGGEFFMTFATALMGRSRGGPAKVAILSSGFFGSLSGSVISNVVTTGQLTIPTMKRVGYPATYAGAVEACASTGGALMPPVMGAVAFIMAEYLNVPYSTVMIAAVMPALLFYLALLFQADHFAARHGLKGQPAEEIPELWPTLKQGWHFLISLVLLVYMLLWGGYPFLSVGEAHAPYVATVILLLTSALQRTTPFRLNKLTALIEDSVKNVANIVGVLAGIGLIVGSLSFTGVGGAFSRELVQFAGNNVFLLLIFGAITSFILGMGMTSSACYIFLAIVLGPALKEVGLDPIASHLFILYWGMLSFITPPVALAAIAASTIAKSNAISTGFMAMRLGIINFILPFLFVLTPTLILRGPALDIVHDVTTAVIAVWLMASAFEGWLYYVGRIGIVPRVMLGLAALMLLDPGLIKNAYGYKIPNWGTDAVGAVLLVLVYVGCNLFGSRQSRAAA